MKKIIMFLMAAFMLSVVPATAQELSKSGKKALKAKVKEFNKEGWKIFGSTSTLDYALERHMIKMQSEDAIEVPGIASSFKSKNVGKQMALNSAMTNYASMMDSEIKGKVVSDMQGDGEFSETEFEKFYAAFKRSVQTTIKDELKESFSIIRDKGNGTSEMQTFFIVDKKAASQARVRALEQAGKESVAAQLYAKVVQKFIEEK
ncbi:MAG: hypothetical protein SPG55_04375 [Prevotella sp.]|nr:hypothetical protein [Prevotella sp.]MCI7579914.1 hypothetical protein [Prevotella sp.]MDD7074559.1 hypothetical protein [Prevotellaceae bacterium]MDY4556523.1 hypothetical protein [Prevotella sp.]MDY5343429.1 hypothetical protein [Prevotella sp.]